ncbi:MULTISPECIES: 6-carboxytetrahydropterin synthase QueD [Acidithrix]|jgi:6-pyruvoyltetrahydropterin/6-carboxytetrahydropterin synthase|uniref:6-carboxy-5,6,7,8-tetrahydropterin synthase n=1 Tax=Acidithrix ferrooxidans TaxID=1280514 RepID=A0A0D8HCV8_9ACTN|nr:MULTISPECIES: 6-carboxytetrahydropterin synthase QueD [Acidithrix]KJF15734.1 6-carboxy-5,6,7,8-tetrahydropterin synthase [Acidithrix ferrooxidans]CAG4911218.1 unnamed protein product [Acidithrix sp. C25]
MEIYKEFSFDSAHRLPNLPDSHKCSRLHGHTFKVTVYVQGDVDPQLGWVLDFGDIKECVKPIIDELDHRYLNDIDGLENPTSENISRWIFEKLILVMPVSKIMVNETCTSGCIYTGHP